MAVSPDDAERAEAPRLAPRATEPPVVRASRPAPEDVPAARPAPPDEPGPAVERETVRLPNQRGGGRNRPGRRRRAPLPVAGLVAAVWAALTSYLPVAVALTLVAVSAGGSSARTAGRLALAGWLLSHGVPLHTAAGPLVLVPLTVAALAAWRLSRAGVHVARAIGARRSGSVPRAVAAAVAVGVGYGIIGGLAAMLVDHPDVAVVPLRAGLTLGAFAAIAAAVGALRCTGAMIVIGLRLPPVLRDALRTGLVAALLVLAAGAAVTGVALALSGGPASDTLAAYRTGVAGQAGIALICAAYAPNLAVWAAAYLIGPGFAIGAGSVVRVTEVSVGAVPAVPLFAALPGGPLPMAATVLLGVPFLAGVVAGWLLSRRRRRGSDRAGWASLAGSAVLAGPVAGALLGLAALVSSGALGQGRLAAIGPPVLPVAAVGAGVVAVGALIGAVAAHALTTRP